MNILNIYFNNQHSSEKQNQYDMCVCVCVCRERKRKTERQRQIFIIRNSLTQLWNLRSPMFCHLQAGDPENPGVQFQSEFQGLKTRRTNSVSSSSTLKA